MKIISATCDPDRDEVIWRHGCILKFPPSTVFQVEDNNGEIIDVPLAQVQVSIYNPRPYNPPMWKDPIGGIMYEED